MFKRFQSVCLGKVILSTLPASLLLLQSAYAAPPGGCPGRGPKIVVPGFGGNYFTADFNANSGLPGTAGTTIAAVEAATSIAIEQVATRRVQEAQICPVGSTKIDGVCQPVAKKPARPRPSFSSRSLSE